MYAVEDHEFEMINLLLKNIDLVSPITDVVNAKDQVSFAVVLAAQISDYVYCIEILLEWMGSFDVCFTGTNRQSHFPAFVGSWR
jgi:hypothetical protein